MSVVLTQLPLTDVKKTQIITKEETSRTFTFDTADEVTTKEVVEEGKDRPLQIKNRIVANVPAENVLLGYDLEFKDNVFCPELLHVMQGGTLTYAEDKTTFKSYEPPAIGTSVTKTKFDVVTYSAEVGTDGETGRYVKMTWFNGKGNSVPISLKDGEYYANTYTINCRPAQGQKPYKMEIVDVLPE
ncbi:hypothetical protein [Faecalimicrobium sp. JNUCC 81]